MKKHLLSLAALYALAGAAYAGPTGPGGEFVLSEMSHTVMILANQALKVSCLPHLIFLPNKNSHLRLA